ncbi:MAG: hypothetical protein ACHQZS_05505 [Candidatus Binatales bacterium]
MPSAPRLRLISMAIVLAAALPGCYYAGFYYYSANGGGTEAAIGEEHQMDFPAADAFVLTQDALHGAGILFEVKPQESLVTLWQKADNAPGFFAGLAGVQPRYRYEIQAVSEGSAKSKIVVNVRAEDVPDKDLPLYKASTRLDLFNKIDQVAALTPPPSKLPRTGGVNFALLPNEDLRGLAKRTTGNADNWRQIAKDNGLSSPNDLTPLQTIWVSDSLLGSAPKQSRPSDSPSQ